MRVYKRQLIPDSADPDRIYLDRRIIFSTRFGGIYLHKILLPDSDRDLHDHPWRFFSVILKGGYDEERLHRSYKRKWFNWMGLGDYHRISDLYGGKPCWSLVFRGKRQVDWGFLTDEGKVPWWEYLNEKAVLVNGFFMPGPED